MCMYTHVNAHISSPNLNFKLPSQIHPDLSMKLPCFCAILVGSLTRGSRFFNNGIWSVSFTLSVPVFGWLVWRFFWVCWCFFRLWEDVLFVRDLWKEKDLRILKKGYLKTRNQKDVCSKIAVGWSKMSFRQASQLGVLCVLRTHKNMWCEDVPPHFQLHVTLLEPTSFFSNFDDPGFIEQETWNRSGMLIKNV